MHAVVTSAPEIQAPRAQSNAGEHDQFMVGEINSLQVGQNEYEGTNYDMFWGIIFGYILNVLMLLCVKIM